MILAATSSGPVLLVKPADIVEFFGKSNSGKPHKQGGSRTSIQALLRFGVVKGMLSANPRTYYYQLAALVGWTSLLRLSRLRQRTLILTGDRDALVQVYNAHILRRMIRYAELHVIKGEEHFFVVTSAKRTAELIREFLSQQHGAEEPAPMIASGRLRSPLL